MAKGKEEETEKTDYKFVVGEIATQTAPVIVDKETKDQYGVESALAKILNDLEELKQGLL